MVSYGFFDSVNGDRRYSADDFTNYLGNLISDGVIASPSNGLQVQPSEGFTIKVTAGWAYIQHHYVHNDSDFFLTLDQPDIARDRIDRIVIRFDTAKRKVDIAIRKGEPKAVGNASIPAIQRDNDIWELSLAYVYVAEDYTEIKQHYITDERSDTVVCGWVTGLIQQIDTTNLFAQYDSAFWTWFNSIQRDYDSTYVCNGVDDNVKLPEFIQTVQRTRPNINTIAVMGTFGIDDTTEDTGSYSTIVSLWIDNSENKHITLDFSRCDEIQFTKSNDFAMLQNCTVKGLKITVDCTLERDPNYINCLIQMENAKLENCYISGKIHGEITLFYRVVQMLESADAVINTNINVTFPENEIVGIYTTSEQNHIDNTIVKVTGKTATGIHAISSYLSGCTICALADENGKGLDISTDVFAVNCDVTGYTKNMVDYHGVGIYSIGTVKIFLNGIRSVTNPPVLYDCTNAMKLANGSEGFYTGIFNPAVSVPDAVATNQPIKKVTQAEYDALTPLTNVIYVIVG